MGRTEGGNEFDYELDAFTFTPADANGAPDVPDHTINLGFQYRRPLTDRIGIFVRTDFERRGKQFWNPDHSSARSEVDLINANFGFEGDRWDATAWARNLADEEYLAEFELGGFVQPAPPRSYGLDFTCNF